MTYQDSSKNNLIQRSILILLLTVVFLGCQNPSSPIETLDTDALTESLDLPDSEDSIETSNKEEPTEEPDTPTTPTFPNISITSINFTVMQGLREGNATPGRIAGYLNAQGGIPPITFTLKSEDDYFTIKNNTLLINENPLNKDIYEITVLATDIIGGTFEQPFKIPIEAEPSTATREIRTFNGVSFAMRYVPAGTFRTAIGIIPTVVERSVNKGYWIAETEVTQELYEAVMGANPSRFNDSPASPERQSRRPVENIYKYEAVAFCNKLSVLMGLTPAYHVIGITDWINLPYDSIRYATFDFSIDPLGNGFRFPTEDEWVYAAIGADFANQGQINTTGYLKGYPGAPNDSKVGIDNYIWHEENSGGITHEVGLKLPNDIGLYDMGGNVTEFVQCVPYQDYYFGGSIQEVNPSNYKTHFRFNSSPVGIRLVSEN